MIAIGSTWEGNALNETGVKRFIGKVGCHLWRLETPTSNFIGLYDSMNGAADVHIYGPCDSIAIALHVFEYFVKGFHSIVFSIERALGL